MLQGCIDNISMEYQRVFHGCFVGELWVFQGCFKGVASVLIFGFHVCFKGLQGYFDNISSTFQGCLFLFLWCFVGVSRVLQGCRKGVEFLFQR